MCLYYLNEILETSTATARYKYLNYITTSRTTVNIISSNILNIPHIVNMRYSRVIP